MNKINIFCFGFGQVAEAFINKLIDRNINFTLGITSRKDTHQIEINNIKINSYMFENDKFDESINNELEKANYILISIPPVNGEDLVSKNFGISLKKNNNCKWITYLSATSVYGDHKGEWVDEKSITKPTSINGMNRLKAEESWIEISKKYNLPLQIFRLAGIYSQEFNILKRLKNNKVQLVNQKNHFFSRVHVEDIANVLFKSLENFKNNETFNICDDRPASQVEVATYGAKLLKLELPKLTKLNDIESEMLKNFYKDSKKVDNKKMKTFFKYELKYPTYVEGLNEIFNNTF
jgi:nucleoside-diphosphate-sugar epimerase